MLYIFVLGCILLIATLVLILKYVDDMSNHHWTGDDKLAMLYMVALVIFIIFALATIYLYCEDNNQITTIAQSINGAVKHLLG